MHHTSPLASQSALAAMASRPAAAAAVANLARMAGEAADEADPMDDDQPHMSDEEMPQAAPYQDSCTIPAEDLRAWQEFMEGDVEPGSVPGMGDGGYPRPRAESRFYQYTPPGSTYPRGDEHMRSRLCLLLAEILLTKALWALPEAAVESILDIIAALSPELHPDFARNVPNNFRALLNAMGVLGVDMYLVSDLLTSENSATAPAVHMLMTV